MIYKKILYILVLPFFLVSFCYASEAPLSNTGFIKSGIWFSKDPFFAGEKVRIYTILFNGSGEDLIGEVNFENNGKVICKGDFAATSGRTQEVWCDWLAVKGNNIITAKIVNPKISPVGGTPQSVSVDNNISGVSERKIEDPPKIATPNTSMINKNSDVLNLDLGVSSSSSFIEEKMKENLNLVKNNISVVIPKEISRESIDNAKDKIISYIPPSIVNTVKNIANKTGASKLTGPLSFVTDFLIAVYKFVINDPLILVISASYIIWKIFNYIYKKITRPF